MFKKVILFIIIILNRYIRSSECVRSLCYFRFAALKDVTGSEIQVSSCTVGLVSFDQQTFSMLISLSMEFASTSTFLFSMPILIQPS